MKSNEIHPLQDWIRVFLFDWQAQKFTPGTVTYYRVKLRRFSEYCQETGFDKVEQINPYTLREYLLRLENDGLVVGGADLDTVDR